MKKLTAKKISGLMVAGLALFATQASAGTLDDVKARGYINCGVSEGVPGFSNPNSDGVWAGLDVDMCRAVSAVIFGVGDKIKFIPLASKQKILAVVTGQVDLTSRTTTWTMKRDTKEGVDFTTVVFYDGQGFMTRKDLGVKSATELNGATICVTSGTTTELNLADFARSNNMEFEPVVFEGKKEAVNAYRSGRCDALTTDNSQLAAFRTTMKDPSAHVVLPEIISKEPLGPAVRQGDDQWFNIVKWTLYALLEAEELQITKKSLMLKKLPTKPKERRFLGYDGNIGENLGLSNAWARQIIQTLGNYGEIYEKNIGKHSLLNIPRKHNNLWTQGGLHYSPPFR